MPSVGILIFFAIVGAFFCARAHVSGGAVVFALTALLLFVTTPIGSGLPAAISDLLTAIDRAATPALNGENAGTDG